MEKSLSFKCRIKKTKQKLLIGGGKRNGIGKLVLIAIVLWQMFALFLRPKKDHKYRMYWNVYHHSLGYSILILGIINVFKGFNMLNPDRKWKSAYIVVIAVVGVIAVILEAFTWVVVLKRKSSNKSTKPFDSESHQ